MCGFSAFNHTPFITDQNSYDLDRITVIDENGKVMKEYREDIDMDVAAITYYSKWEKKGDGYIRNVDYYMPKDYTPEELKVIVEQEKQFDPSLKTTETKNFLTDEELENNKSFLKAVIVEKDAKTVTIRETELENEATTTMAIGMFFLLSYGIKKTSKTRKKVK